jgi:hypothetical protein
MEVMLSSHLGWGERCNEYLRHPRISKSGQEWMTFGCGTRSIDLVCPKSDLHLLLCCDYFYRAHSLSSKSHPLYILIFPGKR